ncbi:MAG: glutamine synthetase family protein [Pseudomonadota bacterium]
MDAWLRQRPNIRSIRVAASDLNGQARGKRIPARFADKALAGKMRFPYSVLNLDIWGDDIEDSPLVLASGDQDGVLRPTARGFMPMPWLETPTALLPLWMFHNDGTPFAGDPRHALDRVLARYRARGLTPVCAVELEFFLIDDSGPELQVPRSPRSGKRRAMGDILSMRALDQFDSFFSELYDACDDMDIPADAALSESGLGQFEINLMHGADALRSADDAWAFKLLVKGLARKHGFAASFMAKPYPDTAGSGLHMHCSVLNADGQNIFDNGGPDGTDVLRHAIAGCLTAMPGCALIFAPHANSYERVVPGAHAPTSLSWAYENRTASLRVPSGPPAARRIEHRVAGGDVNPYLMMAAILGAAMNGIEDAAAPAAPITGNAYTQGLPQITGDWHAATQLFETDAEVARIFAPELIRNYVLTKRQEQRRMAKLSPAEQVEIYLETV